MYNYSEAICSESCKSFMLQNYMSQNRMPINQLISIVILACITYIIIVAIIKYI
jgi:predicted nucleic acid-binding Zn ribbon protein